MRLVIILFSTLLTFSLGVLAIVNASSAAANLPALDQFQRRAAPDAAARLTTAAHDPFLTDATLVDSFHGENPFDAFGWVGKRLGDLDNDGINDFVLTAPFYLSGTTLAGRAYVYSAADGSLLATHTATPFSLMGYSASSAGDVDSDGVDDYIFGAPIGNFAVIYSGIDHTPIMTLTGSPGDGFGAWVATAGDVNNDNHADLFVGATQVSAGAMMTATGSVYMYSGSDGALLWQQSGETAFSFLGGGVGAVGDVDGDSVNDVVATAGGYNNGNGRGYVYSGVDGDLLYTLESTAPYSGSGTYGVFFASGGYDVDLDGVNDIYIGDYAAGNGSGRVYVYSGTDGALLYQFDPPTPGAGMCCGSLIPDQNKDGYPDILIASYLSSAGVPGGGRVDVYSGKDASLIRSVLGGTPGNALGVDAQWIGDVNGDGFDEFLATAVGLDFGGVAVGDAYLFNFARRQWLPIVRE